MSAETLDALVAELRSKRIDRRIKAHDTLSEMVHDHKDPAELADLAKRLAPLTGDADSGLRARAIALVGAIDGEAALPLLMAHSADPEPEVRAVVEDVAEDLGDPGRPLLKKLARDSNFGVRFWAGVALAEAGDGDSYDVLVEGLSTSATRFEALQGLRRLGDRRAESPVRKVLAKWFLAAIDRVAALGVIASFGDGPAKEMVLAEIVRSKSDVRGLAMEIAGELKLAEAVPVLEKVLRDKADECRGSAAMGLGAMKQEPNLAELVALVRAEDESADLRGDAAWALRLFGTDAAVQALKDAEAATKQDEVRESIREALAAR